MEAKTRKRPWGGGDWEGGERRRGEREARGRALAALADRQHGVIGRRQLLALGVGPLTMHRWLREGRLHRLHREAFAVGHRRVSWLGGVLAAVLACGEGALLSHRSAAALWGLSRRRGPTIDVTAPAGRQFRPGRRGICLHRCRIHDGIATKSSGVPVTTVSRTLFDLAEVVDRQQLRRAWEEADRLGMLRLTAIEQICEQGYGRHALRPIRALLAEARTPAYTRSALEQRFAEFCRGHLAGLPPPQTNVLVLGLEVDAYWPSKHLVVELDGYAYHHHRAAFERDRARDAAMQAAGYRVLRITHRRLCEEPAAVASQLRRILTGTPPAGGAAGGSPIAEGAA